MRHLLKGIDMLGHQEILSCLVGISLEPGNKLTQVLQLFQNREGNHWSQMIGELRDTRLPRTSDDNFRIEDVKECNQLSYSFDPLEQTVERFDGTHDDNKDFFVRHFYLDFRKTFFVTQRLDEMERQYTELFNEVSAIEQRFTTELRTYGLFKTKGFYHKRDLALLLHRVCQVSGDRLENFGVIKAMIWHQYDSTSYIHRGQAGLFWAGYVAPLTLMLFSREHYLNWALSIACVAVQGVMLFSELI